MTSASGMFPMPGHGVASLDSMRLQGSPWNLRASCAAQPPYKVIRPNIHMRSVASDMLLQQAHEDGLGCFFSSASAASVESWVAAKLQGAVEVDCVLGAVLAQWDVQPHTVWLRLIWPEPVFKRREEFLLSFLGSLEPVYVGRAPQEPISLSQAWRPSRRSRASGLVPQLLGRAGPSLGHGSEYSAALAVDADSSAPTDFSLKRSL